MSRNRNSRDRAATSNRGRSNIVKPGDGADAVSHEGRTDESVIRQVSREDAPRTLRTGSPLAGSEVLEAVGSNGTVGRAMHDVVYAPDDEKMMTRLGPEQEASVAFRPDEALGDAGAEFAAEFGRDFLMAATAGEDISEIYNATASETSDAGSAYLQEVGMNELEDLTEFAEPGDEEEEDEDDSPSR